LLLAGDWTDTRLPGTIEGAIRSGKTAAELIPQARNAAKPIAKKPRIVANVE
jgi:monoamine oxidase